jgi:parallel beta-helix repeat protein
MLKRIVLCTTFILLLVGALTFEMQLSKSANPPWLVGVGQTFTTIQEAINDERVLNGDTIEVMWKSTPYSENVTVNKSLIIRQYSETPSGVYPTVDGVNWKGAVFNITSSNVEVSGFNITRGKYGIIVSNQSAKIHDNLVCENTYGIFLTHSYNNTLRRNNMTRNTWNFGVGGSDISHFMQDIDDSNSVEGKPVCYWVNQSHRTVQSNAGYVAVVDSEDISVRGLQLENNVQGVLVAYSDNVIVEDLEFAHRSQICVRLINATGSFVQDMTALIPITTSSFVSLTNSTSNVIRNNSISGVLSPYQTGIALTNSNYNNITNNTINTMSGGIDLRNSHHNSIIDNTINGMSSAGVYLNQCLNNTLVGNTLSGNNYGMLLQSGSNNSIIFHNNFLDNHGYQAQVSILCSNNKFDNGYEGNYWSDYVGEDMNKDGIGDLPYPIEIYCQDSCPLKKAWKAWKAFEPMEKYYVETPNQKLCTFSNSTLASICLDRNLKQITLNVTSGYTGFLNITIPRRWLDGPFNVSVDGVEVKSFKDTVTATHWSLYFAFDKGSHNIKIIGIQLGNILGDLDGDGDVDLYDAVALLSNYGNHNIPIKIYLSETE